MPEATVARTAHPDPSLTLGMTATYDVERIRRDFPILSRSVHGKPLVYLDNAATTQKPNAVIDRIVRYYREENANVHRGVHYLSEIATSAYENVRTTVKKTINARSEKEIVFNGGTTEGINLIAYAWGRKNVAAGDEIIISAIEHHSDIVPWQMLCQATGATLRIIPVSDEGELLLDDYAKLLSPRTKLVAVGHASNALGTINPVKKIAEMAHAYGAIVVIDGAQGIPHLRIDVQDIGCDFYTFSAHKVYGPTGSGVLYGKEALLEAMPPYEGGGDMILSVSFEKTTYNALPYKFEAGTPDIAGVIAMGAALEYVASIGVENIAAHEHDLLLYATKRLQEIDQLRIIGTAAHKAAVISFVLEGVHPHDIGTILDQEGIAIRTGHHCAQPLMLRYNIPATGRASFAMYNTREEVDALVAGIGKVLEVFG
ncbi:MAG: cysteine desulfurase / selenocysteine lyase [Acidobacteriota bacterium]|jgi:cysteine desulfurase/selenocysteine lyase|nr:cysteine desulfurase / selenocysteine lyase [Acidobacteriota bacterium]